MYSIYAYGRMIADQPRMQAYRQALQRTVKPGSVVVDLGTGTGVLALLACQLGARRVYAIDPSDAIHLGRQLAEANGCATRTEFIQKLSTDVTLPERADVIVSDLRGVLPLFDGHVPAIIDARTRLLAPGGQLVPRRDHLRVSLIEAPDDYATFTNPWIENKYGLDMTPGHPLVVNCPIRKGARPEMLLTEPQTWATLDYTNIQSPHVRGAVEAICVRPGTAHGLLMWFDAELADGVGFTNAPGAPDLIYGSLFYPLPAPIAVSAGDTVVVTLHANLVGDDYLWRWNTTVSEAGTGRVKAALRQSTFDGMLLVSSRLRKRAANHRPYLDSEGIIDRVIMELMDGSAALAEIARRVHEQFPERFSNYQDTLNRVRALSERYSSQDRSD